MTTLLASYSIHRGLENSDVYICFEYDKASWFNVYVTTNDGDTTLRRHARLSTFKQALAYYKKAKKFYHMQRGSVEKISAYYHIWNEAEKNK